VYEALLVLHVLAAFAMTAAVVLFGALVLAVRRVERPGEVVALFRISRAGDVLVAAGSVGTLVFGIWLAIYLDEYHPWDPWIVAALVLWAANGAAGNASGKHYYRARDRARERLRVGDDSPDPTLQALLGSRRALALHLVVIATVLAILALMIFKPGA
jgi:uncharacterized membrane protein